MTPAARAQAPARRPGGFRTVQPSPAWALTPDRPVQVGRPCRWRALRGGIDPAIEGRRGAQSA